MSEKMEKAVFTAVVALLCRCMPVYLQERHDNDVCEARAGLFKCQRRSRKLVSPLCWHCEVGVSLFLCGKDFTKPF